MVENVALEHSRLNTEAIGIGDLLALPPNVLVIFLSAAEYSSPIRMHKVPACRMRIASTIMSPQIRPRYAMHLQDRIIGWLDRNEDIFCLLSSSQAVYAAIAQVDWMKLRLLR